MNSSKKIPLAERMHSVVPSKADIPLAMGLRPLDLLELVGEMTGQEARYEGIYQTYIAPHSGTEETPKRVYKLVIDAGELGPKERANILFWLLVDPFATLNNIEGSEVL